MDSFLLPKVLVALGLGAIIVAGVLARPPRRPLARADLRMVMLAALGLYGVGLGASLTHHPTVAMAVYVTGIAMSSLAAWLSRGHGSDGPPRGGRDDDPPPPDGPSGGPEFDWDAFEREFGAYAERRRRQPVLSR